jgi:hypothetical protein
VRLWGPTCESEPAFSESIERWGNLSEAACYKTDWDSTEILGEPDIYPSYEAGRRGFCWARSNEDTQWIELRFPKAVYVSGIEIYEVFEPGSLQKVSIASSTDYADDNTVHCGGASTYKFDDCATETVWTTIWQGVASPATEKQATITAPPVCSIASEADLVRLEFDTAAVPGWNTFDAVMLHGGSSPTSGLVLANVSAVKPNQVIYAPWPGLHGKDFFEYSVSDCFEWGKPSPVHVTVEPPGNDFSEAIEYDVGHHHFPNDTFLLAVDLPKTLANLSATFRLDLVRIELRAMENLVLESADDSEDSIDMLAIGSSWDVSVTEGSSINIGDVMVMDTPARLELWLSPIDTDVTYRTQAVICQPYATWVIDTPSLSGCVGCEVILSTGASENHIDRTRYVRML